ncbi:5-dehydro-2-deoxygluconokinase [uncultured Paludibaculum sp.]|uniref:5-dehydro-2-deoxygluconokinase n=1 Tax=uncultured Paludibaculum sp. TaxID=1765020 RepID=UPI002AAB97B9|nr:5-dehydro-2-deoxygluconokinase [uncultured Paludibaculum sp.]
MDIAILGRIGYDLYSEEPHVPLPQVRRFSRYLGGSSANMAVGLSRLGASVGIISCLGNDSLSQFLLDFLKNEKVDTARVQTKPGFLPSLCLTEVAPPDRFPQVFYRHDAVDTLLTSQPGDLDYVAQARMFITNGTSLCASPSREATYRALERAHKAGCRVVLDVDFRAMSWPSPEEAGLAVRLALPFVDVLIGNQPELMLVAGEPTLEAATEKLRSVPVLVSKLGEQGTRVWTGSESVFLPPYKVEVCTTIGAGDGFASGFLYALLQGLPIEECLHYGNAAAAIVVSRLSCSEAMPTMAEVRALLNAQRSVATTPE